ncbi:MAG: DMT family transporter [Acidimicrobiia bacterium]|nr:DMT family transporter [Acidimicrobiia bacterium]MDH3462736.1 DMT family transporter [Acidimicrobiia bacterium]
MSTTARTRAIAALIVASFLFGATFVVIKSALEDIPPLSFVAWRFLIGSLALVAISVPRGRQIWRDGAIAGLALFAGYSLQTAGLQLTSASNSALITGLYVVLTPFLAGLFHRFRPSGWSVGAAGLAFIGLVLVTGTDSLSLSPGDLLTLGCAVAFAFHIVALSRLAPRHAVVPFTAVQLAVTALLAIPTAAVVDGFSMPDRSVWGALAVVGIGVTVGAFVLQIWAQTVVGAATTAVVLAAEPAFGVATAWAVLGDRLDWVGWVGAGLILSAMAIVVTKQRDQSSIQAEAVTPAH